MKAEALRALQAPLKERYRADAGTALVTVRARGDLDHGFACSVETGRELVRAGLHPATLGVDRGAPVGFTKIRLHVQLDSDASPEQAERS